MNFSDLSSIQIPKIKISVRIIAVAIAIIGLIIFGWITTKKVPEIEAETARFETEIASLTTTEQNLSNLYQSMSFYLDETQRLYDETEIILDEFPTFMYLEDKILYADTILKTDLSGYNMTQFSYGQSNFVMDVTYGPEEKSLQLYSVQLGGRYEDLTYVQIKQLLDYGLNAPQRFVFDSINMSYSEKSGYISGQFAFSTYFVPGQSTPYEFPASVIEVLGNSNRIDDLFGARKTPKPIDQTQEE